MRALTELAASAGLYSSALVCVYSSMGVAAGMRWSASDYQQSDRPDRVSDSVCNRACVCVACMRHEQA